MAEKKKPGPKPQAVAIKPVEGQFIAGVPAVEMVVPKGQAAVLVKTGAFTYGGSAKMTDEKAEAGEAAAEALKADAGPTAPDSSAEEAGTEVHVEVDTAKADEDEDEGEDEDEAEGGEG